VFTVNVPPAIPNLSSPVSDAIIADSTPTFDWEIVLNATTYQIQVDNDGDFSSPEFDDTGLPNTRESLAVFDDGIYHWRVRAFNLFNKPGEWSETRVITISIPLEAPVLVLPADQSIDVIDVPAFIWESISNATGYQIQVDDNADFGSLEFEVLSTSPNYTPVVPLINHQYYWRVRALNDHNTPGIWSTVWSFIISAP
jgi:hypothetical protein